MCPPLHFGVLYEINPWMHTEVRVDVDRAMAQWEGLVANLRGRRRRGRARSSPQAHVPDLVFTANAGLVSGTAVRAVALPASRSASPRPRCSPRGSRPPATTVLPPARRPRPRGRRRRPAVLGADGRAVLLSGYRPRSDAAAGTRADPAARLPGAVRRARRRAAVPRRPHVLPARRPPRHLRPARLGRLRPQGRRGARARAAVARRRRGPRLLAPTRSSSAAPS